MKPDEILLNLTVQGCKLAFRDTKQSGMEYALIDILSYCRDHKRNQFGTISLPQLIYFFKKDSKLDVPLATKLRGLNGLLESGYLRKPSRESVYFGPKLKRVCIKYSANVTIKEVPASPDNPIEPTGSKAFSAHS